MRKIFTFILSFLIILPIAYSVGISPAEVNINFEPNLERTVTYNVRSNMAKPMYVLAQVTGSLSEYASLDKNEVYLEPGEYGQFKVHIKLPKSIDRPGYHIISFIATESQGTGGTVGARGEVISLIRIFVQYPGKYLGIELQASDAKIGDDVNFKVKLRNLGKEMVNSASAVIDIYDENKKIASVNTNEKSVEVLKDAELTAKWNTKGQKPGNYRAVAKVRYDEKTGEAEDSFRIGTLNVKIIEFTREVYEKQANEFRIKIESEWNDPVENLFADVKVSDEGREMTSFTASEKLLKQWEIKDVIGYLDGNDLEVGEYDVNIVMTFNEIGEDEKYESRASGKINVLKSELKEKVVFVKGKVFTATNILLAVLILLVIFNMVWFLKRRKNEKEGNQS